jgi:hypothetical protein
MFADAKIFDPIVWKEVKGVKVTGIDRLGDEHKGELYLLKGFDADQLHLYGITPINEIKIGEIKEISGAEEGQHNTLVLELIK